MTSARNAQRAGSEVGYHRKLNGSQRAWWCARLRRTEIARNDDSSIRLSLGAVFEAGLTYLVRYYAVDELWLNSNGTVTFGAQAMT